MPKKPRSAEEIEAVRVNILDHALELIINDGFEGLSMRKLAKRLGVAAVTIYSYFENKDEIYLAVLTKGFEKLFADCETAYHSCTDPLLRLKAMVVAYVDFGFNETHFYNLMFTWRVPKYQDFINTPLQESASRELEVALKVNTIFIKAAGELVNSITTTQPESAPLSLNKEDLRLHVIIFWCTLHGYISGCANTLLNYLHEAPQSLKDPIIELTFTHIEHEVNEMKAGRGGRFEEFKKALKAKQ